MLLYSNYFSHQKSIVSTNDLSLAYTYTTLDKRRQKKKTKKKQLICIMYDQQENATQGVKNEF